jgi:wyosine [tRNA(Phe)-imidazoG37] synthetase (radical SAM superfamily)
MKSLKSNENKGILSVILQLIKNKLVAFSDRLQTSISKDLCKDGKVIFGPFQASRLGMCLGINNVKSKACSYNCVYCKSGNTSCCSVCCNTCLNPWNLASCVKRKITELQQDGIEINCVAFMPDGEATLDSNISQKIQLIHALGVKTAVFTNASLLWNYNVQQNLLSADNVILKIDSVNVETWERINRPHLRLNFNLILDSVREFASQYRGVLSTETVLVEGYNNNVKEMKKLAEYFTSLKPVSSVFSFNENTRVRQQNELELMEQLNLSDYIKRNIPNSKIVGCREANHYLAATA